MGCIGWRPRPYRPVEIKLRRSRTLVHSTVTRVIALTANAVVATNRVLADTFTGRHYPSSVSIHVVTGDLSDRLAAELRQLERVAVDTETTGLDWQQDSLELCQLFSPTSGSILVRRSETWPINLLGLLEDPQVTKVFHHAPFDLRFIEATWGARTNSVFCTKAASKLLDPQLPVSEHSLAPLLKRHFGIHLDKGAVRVSDWGAQVLSPEQEAYAAADVSHLLKLAALEHQRLQTLGLQSELDLICAYMPLDAHFAVTGVPNPLTY